VKDLYAWVAYIRDDWVIIASYVMPGSGLWTGAPVNPGPGVWTFPLVSPDREVAELMGEPARFYHEQSGATQVSLVRYAVINTVETLEGP
jgi:hypothetical protein